MFPSCFRLHGVLGPRIWRSSPSSLRLYSVGRSSHGQRDYGLPNSTWNQHTRDLYEKYEELSKSGDWKRIPSYNWSMHHLSDEPPKDSQVTRFFTRNIDQDGLGFEYCMFYNKAEKRMICILQPGPYLEGPPGYTHGGCIATILDVTLGGMALHVFGQIMTANLNITYRSAIPLGCTVLVDSHMERVEGRKVFARGQIRSHDDQTVHAEATGLFIRLNPSL
ncbi:acyl-coenzyme A thioesterase THEM4-like isoform X2 [Dendropsophus ebraccatus]